MGLRHRVCVGISLTLVILVSVVTPVCGEPSPDNSPGQTMLLDALGMLGYERDAKPSDSLTRYSETLAVLDELIGAMPSAPAGLSARALRMHLRYDLSDSTGSLDDAGWLLCFHPDTWQAGWAHTQMGVHAMYEACAKADDDDETRRAEAPDDFASCIQHMSRAIPLLCQLSDEEWEPFATRGQFPASRTEVFEATAAIWKGPAHAALGEWDVAAGCYWYVMEIVPGSHTARLAEKYLAELVNAGLVAKRVPGLAQSFVSLRAAFETGHTSVDWDEMAGEATIRGRGIMLKVRPGTVAFSANGRVVWLDRPPLMEGGRVMVPKALLREVASLCAREDTTRDRGRHPAFIGPPPPASRAQLAALWRLE